MIDFTLKQTYQKTYKKNDKIIPTTYETFDTDTVVLEVACLHCGYRELMEFPYSYWLTEIECINCNHTNCLIDTGQFVDVSQKAWRSLFPSTI